MQWKKPVFYGCGGCVVFFGLLSIISGIVVAIQALNEPPEPQQPPEEKRYPDDPRRRPAPPSPQPPEIPRPPQPRREDDPPARAGDAGAAKEVWLHDPERGVPFCRVALPGDWQVEGNVAWNPNMPMSPYVTWIRFSNERRGVTVESMTPVGAFKWEEMLENLTGLQDGTYLIDTGMFMVKYRTAEALLRDFITPLVRTMNPRARIGAPQNDPEEALAARQDAAQEAGAMAAVYAWDGWEGTAATMRVDDGEKTTEFGCSSIGFVKQLPLQNFRSYYWRWIALLAITTPAGQSFPLEEARSLVERIAVNPEWEHLRNQEVSRLQSIGAKRITPIHEAARRAIRQSGEVTEKWAGKWSDYIRDESNYAAPSGEIFKGPSTRNFGYLNGFGDAVVFSDQQISAANLNGYSEMLRLD